MERAQTTATNKLPSQKSCSTAAAEGPQRVVVMKLQWNCDVFSPQGWALSDSSYLCCRQSSMWKPQVRNHCQCYWQVHQTPQPFQTGVGWIMRRATRGLVWDLSNSLSNRLNELWKQTENDLGVSLRESFKDTEHSQKSHAGGSWEWILQCKLIFSSGRLCISLEGLRVTSNLVKANTSCHGVIENHFKTLVNRCNSNIHVQQTTLSKVSFKLQHTDIHCKTSKRQTVH